MQALTKGTNAISTAIRCGMNNANQIKIQAIEPKYSNILSTPKISYLKARCVILPPFVWIGQDIIRKCDLLKNISCFRVICILVRMVPAMMNGEPYQYMYFLISFSLFEPSQANLNHPLPPGLRPTHNFKSSPLYKSIARYQHII